MTEAELQRAIIELAELLGWRVHHVANVKGQLRSATAVGFPDLCMVRRGRLIFAELKSDAGKLSAEQLAWHDALLDISYQTPAEAVEMFVWRPKHWTSGIIEAVLKAE